MATATYIGGTGYTNTGSNNPFTFSSAAIGEPAGDRLVVLCLYASSGTPDILAITVNGYPLAKVVEQEGSTEMWAGYVPEGATGDIVITKASASSISIRVDVYAAYGVHDIAEDIASSTASNMSMALDVTEGAVIIAFGSYTATFGGGSFSWSGVTEDFDVATGGLGGAQISAGHTIAESDQAGYAITSTTGGFGASNRRGISASFPIRDPGTARLRLDGIGTAAFSGAFASSAASLSVVSTSNLQATSKALKKTVFAASGSVTTALRGDDTFPTLTTGWILPAQGRTDDSAGTVAWSNPENITADDASYASAASSPGSTTHFLVADTFNLGSVIKESTFLRVVGIEVRIDWGVSGTLAGATLSSVNVGEDDETLGTPKTGSTIIFPLTAAVDTLGAMDDLWNLGAISYEELIADTFQVRVAHQIGGAFGTVTVGVDHVAVRIHYKRTHYNFADGAFDIGGTSAFGGVARAFSSAVAAMAGTSAMTALRRLKVITRAYFFG